VDIQHATVVCLFVARLKLLTVSVCSFLQDCFTNSLRADEFVSDGLLFLEFVRRELHPGPCKIVDLKTCNVKQVASRTAALMLSASNAE
jgi:hypothetical protein